jgi:hypothetical protein
MVMMSSENLQNVDFIEESDTLSDSRAMADSTFGAIVSEAVIDQDAARGETLERCH